MKIVCFGDSLTACGGANGRFGDILADRFPDHAFVDRGVGGETIADGLARLDGDVLAEAPDVVLVEFGANDWWRDERPPQAWAADLEEMLRRITDAGARAVVLGVFGDALDEDGNRVPKPSGTDDRALAWRELERAAADKHGCPYVANIQERIVGRRTAWADANHPNAWGNRYVADAVEPVLADLLGDGPRPVRKPTLATLRDLWDEATALAPDATAVVDGDRRLTYAEADERVERLAANLARLCRTDRPTVAVFLPNGLEYFLVYWAVARLGGVVVPVNTWLKDEALEAIFRAVRPDALFVRDGRDMQAAELAQAHGTRIVAALDPGFADLYHWRVLLRDGASAPRPPVGEDDLAIVMHTSGTTAAPKGAMMRHGDLFFNIMAAVNAHGFDGDDVHLLVNPMFHCTALYTQLPLAAYTKTPVAVVATTSPERLMETVARERVTTFLSVPSVFQRILSLRNLDDYDASSLRLIAYAGSPMPVEAIRGLRERFPGAALHNFFGLTETISMTHVLRARECFPQYDEEGVETAPGRPDSIGRLLPFVEAVVVDEDLRPLPPGETGELLFARENVIPGYYGDPHRLADALVTVAGRTWFRTGDLATVDEDGYFFLKGRKKEMIIVGGENVYAREVETVLQAHPAVREAAVKGAPATGAMAFLGEQVMAWVVTTGEDAEAPGEADLRRWCYERLESYKVPQRIAFVEALPRNPAGKIRKDALCV